MVATAERDPSLVAAAGWSYFPVAFLARLPYAMMVVGVLTVVVSGRDSLAFGGLSSAMVGIGAAGVGPLVGATVDRFGQRRIVALVAVLNCLALLAMTWIVYSSLPPVAVLMAALAVGASAPHVGALSRTRLVWTIASRMRERRRAGATVSAMAYESTADEVIFVIGPVLVGALATAVSAAAPMVVAAVLVALFGIAFALHPTGNGAPTRRQESAQQAPVAALLQPRVVVVAAGVFAMGLVFGTSLVGVSAFASDTGDPEAGGLYYALMGVGSAIVALGSARLPARFTLGARWICFAAILVVGTVAMALAPSPGWLIVGLTLAGIGVGPTLVSNFSLGAERSPHGRSATVMAILGSAAILGQSLGAAITGAIGQWSGATAAMIAPLIAALFVLAAALKNRQFL